MKMVPLISIIDDDSSVRIALEDLVCSLGFDACAFESAQDFLRSPHVGGTSCLITDLQMPGMNGLELQCELLAQGHRIPVIFITAFPEKTIQARAEAAGAVAFLEKPFDGCSLAGLICDVVADRG
jgi:FixJ family two-component response regulator